jgi:hypothetical protein
VRPLREGLYRDQEGPLLLPLVPQHGVPKAQEREQTNPTESKTMNAKTLAVALILVTGTAGAQGHISGNAYGHGYQPQFRPYVAPITTSQLQSFTGSSTMTVFGDDGFGMQTYIQSGNMTMRIGEGDGPWMWIQSGPMIMPIGGGYRQW